MGLNRLNEMTPSLSWRYFQKLNPTRFCLAISFLGGAYLCKSPKYSSLVNKHAIKLWNLGSRDGSDLFGTPRFVVITLELLMTPILGKKCSSVPITSVCLYIPLRVTTDWLWIGIGGNLITLAFVWEFFRISAAFACNSCNLRLGSSFRLAFLCISRIFLCLSLWALHSLLYNWIMSLPILSWPFHWPAARMFSEENLLRHIDIAVSLFAGLCTHDISMCIRLCYDPKRLNHILQRALRYINSLTNADRAV